MPIPVNQVLKSGVLIVVSKSSQEMYVFEDGELWGASPVSTGKRGKETPSGVFPILQKRRHHRSNLYSNSPMPYMQRMTWDGIAIHQGRLPGYPASHGCIRLPRDFARGLFQLTGRNTTTVVVTDHALATGGHARLVAASMAMPQPGQRGHLIQGPEPQLAELDTPLTVEGSVHTVAEQSVTKLAAAPAGRRARTIPSGRTQTIQLAAAENPAEANAYWASIRSRFPELNQYEKSIVAARVNAKTYYRLRVTGPGAKASCLSLRKAGADCFSVS